VIAEFHLHPNSFITINESSELFTPYLYNDILFSTVHTDIFEEYRFSFRKNENYYYALDHGSFIFKGSNAPKYYLNFFHLQPEKCYPDVAPGSPFLYYYSNTFCSGFSNTVFTWEYVFNYIFEGYKM
jgi:hypothetical protein